MRGANTFVISIRRRLFSDVSARTESDMETVVVPDDGLVILNGPRVKVRSYSERCQISWSNYGPVIVSEYAKTAFGSHPYRVVSITYDLTVRCHGIFGKFTERKA